MLSYLSAFSIVAAILLILGISLVIFEMFIPGFGAPGISGIVLIISREGKAPRFFPEGICFAFIHAVVVFDIRICGNEQRFDFVFRHGLVTSSVRSLISVGPSSSIP